MKPAERIIEKFGGVTAMSRALDHRNPSTVQGWKKRGYIPGSRHSKVRATAKRLDIALKLDDFFEPDE